MRAFQPLCSLLLLTLGPAFSCAIVPLRGPHPPAFQSIRPEDAAHPLYHQQQPVPGIPFLPPALRPGADHSDNTDNTDNEPIMAPPGPNDGAGGGGGGGGGNTGSVILSDVLGRDRSINVFAGFTRDVAAVSARLDDGARNSTVLAPLNSRIEQLPRKPWEDPADYDTLGAQAYEGGDGRERAARNLRRFVEAHVVPVSPWEKGQKARTALGDADVWWEEREGKKWIMPDDIEVVSIGTTVANGQVWIIKGVRNYA